MTAHVLTEEHISDAALLAEALHCYFPNARYLSNARVRGLGDTIEGTGDFAIPESCYIDSTGHLNAVEVVICYNQLLYTMLGTMVRDRLHPCFDSWTMADYWRRRLPDVLIAENHQRFLSPIDPAQFQGRMVFANIHQRSTRHGAPYLSLDTTFEFTGVSGGRAEGSVRIAIVDTGTTDGFGTARGA